MKTNDLNNRRWLADFQRKKWIITSNYSKKYHEILWNRKSGLKKPKRDENALLTKFTNCFVLIALYVSGYQLTIFTDYNRFEQVMIRNCDSYTSIKVDSTRCSSTFALLIANISTQYIAGHKYQIDLNSLRSRIDWQDKRKLSNKVMKRIFNLRSLALRRIEIFLFQHFDLFFNFWIYLLILLSIPLYSKHMIINLIWRNQLLT